MAWRRVSLWLPPKQPFLVAGICSSTYRLSSKGWGGGVCICTPKKRLGGVGARKYLCCEDPLIFLCLWQLDNRWSKTTMEILSTMGLMLHNLWGPMLAYSDLIVWELESSETQSLDMMPRVEIADKRMGKTTTTTKSELSRKEATEKEWDNKMRFWGKSHCDPAPASTNGRGETHLGCTQTGAVWITSIPTFSNI